LLGSSNIIYYYCWKIGPILLQYIVEHLWRLASIQREMDSEIKILKALNHPHIIRFCGVAIGPRPLERALILEYISGGNLFERLFQSPSLPPLTAKERLIIAFDITTALSYLHGLRLLADDGICFCSVLHRDIKSANVVLASQNRANIVGVASSQVIDEMDAGCSIGVQNFTGGGYIAPEVMSGEYGEKCEIFSVGAVLFELLSSSPAADLMKSNPLQPSLTASLWYQLFKGMFLDRNIMWPGEPANGVDKVNDCASRCVALNPSDRPKSMREVLLARSYSA
jgi:eukaryotic-like serine/threonine-protein kinase